MSYDLFQPVIGLEIHVQLNTKTKLFSSCPNVFKGEPNTNIDEVSTGQPGTLPVVNKEAIKKAILFGLAVDAKIERFIYFDRKSYFYPDTPRNFQITQFETPIIKEGMVIADVEGKTKKFPISHAHLEDDAGMLKHISSYSLVDYNRAGAPLLEIVSKPKIYSPKEASSYAKAIKTIMEHIDCSDCNMEMGHLRIDANISVRPKNEKTLRNKIEIKNINSFSNLEKSLHLEIKRQISLYINNPHKNINEIIPQETYRWNAQKKQNIFMRKKEYEADYRYFPEPDIPPIVLTSDYIEKLKKEMPELPHNKYDRYVKDLKLSEYSASVLINDKKLSDYFEKCLKYTDHAKILCNWITVEFAGKDISIYSIPEKNVADLVNLIKKEVITARMAKKISDIMIKYPNKSPLEIIKENDEFQPIKDESSIEPIVDKILKENPQSIKDYKKGKKKALAFLIGQVMKETKGKASPNIVNKLIIKKISFL